MRTFVIGDIHGNYKGLLQCLERSGFDRANDELITLGDICDGWPYVYECVEELLTIKNRIDIKGNHDEWFLTFVQTLTHPAKWAQGGRGTARSYLTHSGKEIWEKEEWVSNLYGQIFPQYEFNLDPFDVPPQHQLFFRGQHLYYKDDALRVFVHAGFDRKLSLRENQRLDAATFYWDRTLFHKALCVKDKNKKLRFKENISEVFIGHTSTTNWKTRIINSPQAQIVLPHAIPVTVPIYYGGVWNMDTGGGLDGRLTIMDVETHQYWQSDTVQELYPIESQSR